MARLERIGAELATRYGYRPIETPMFEQTAVFERGIGEVTDVVEKELFRLAPRSDEAESWALRPEPTAGIVRAYVQHGMRTWPQPVKLTMNGPMFRYDRPQAGRFRQFWQFDVEAIGDPGPAIDAEIIELAHRFYAEAGLQDIEIRLNSIGDPACRPAYVAELAAYYRPHADRLPPLERGRLERNPLRLLDSKAPLLVELNSAAPKIPDHLCDACNAHFAAVRAHLDALDVPYRLTPTLVRGLDYYTRTTWEFVGPKGGAQRTLSGGGRYDGLVEEIGGPPAPGVGFGAGIERLVLALEPVDLAVGPPTIDVFFALDGGAPRHTVSSWLHELRNRGIAADTDYAGRSLKGQLTQAGRLGATTVVVARAGGASIRRAGHPDEEVALDDVLARLTA
jgi:histidyl-tRNA synthetase